MSIKDGKRKKRTSDMKIKENQIEKKRTIKIINRAVLTKINYLTQAYDFIKDY